MAYVTFEKHQYEFAHGRPPRGKGCWAFSIKGVHKDGAPEIIFAPGMQTFRDACKWMREEVARRGLAFAVVVVQS